MVYRNRRTGAVIDFPCPISGEHWEEVISSQETAANSAPEPETPAVPDQPAKKTSSSKASAKKKTPAKKPAKKATAK